MNKLVILLIVFMNSTMAFEETPALRVSGNSIVFITPDSIEISFEISSAKEQAADAKVEHDRIFNAVRDYLNTKGIKNAEMSVDQMGFAPEYRSHGGNYFKAFTTLTIRYDDIAKSNDLQLGLIKLGVGKINYAKFISKDMKTYYDKVRTYAVNDAKEKAKQLANDLNIKLGAVINVKFEESYYSGEKKQYRYTRVNEKGISEDYGMPTSVSVQATVNIAFAILP